MILKGPFIPTAAVILGIKVKIPCSFPDKQGMLEPVLAAVEAYESTCPPFKKGTPKGVPFLRTKNHKIMKFTV